MIKHVICRSVFYSTTQVKRFIVPDEKVSWSTNYEDYNPTKFESDILKGKGWADPSIDDVNFKPKFNELDGNVNRLSHLGLYEISSGVPSNPCGR